MTNAFIKTIKADILRFSGSQSFSSTRLWVKVIHPRFLPILFLRCSLYFHRYIFLKPLSYLLSILNVILFGIEVSQRCKIGPGLLIPHTFGVVIGASEIGSNVTIFQGVTLGAKYYDLHYNSTDRPVIEDEVVIGAGAKVLGGIRVGQNSVIAANSLVIESVPRFGFAMGVPANVEIREK